MIKESINEFYYKGVKYYAYSLTCSNGKVIPAIGTTPESCKKQVTTIIKSK